MREDDLGKAIDVADLYAGFPCAIYAPNMDNEGTKGDLCD